MFREEAKAKIETFAALGDNWDGYGASACTAVDRAAMVVRQLPGYWFPIVDVMAMPNGGVVFEWHFMSLIVEGVTP